MQKAIHAIPKTWEGCGGVSYAYGYESIIPFYQYILDNSELQMLVYSGDEDTVVPFMGTEQWVLDLKQPNQTMRGPWYSEWSGDGNQVAEFGTLPLKEQATWFLGSNQEQLSVRTLFSHEFVTNSH